MIPWWIDSPRDEGEAARFGIGVGGLFDPQLCSGEAMFHLLGLVGDIAILFGLDVGMVRRL